MPTLEQIGAALRAADAAGNTEDARRLAVAYAAARNASLARADFSGVTAKVNGERVGKSGVRESERRAQLDAADRRLDYENRLDSLNTQESLGRALGVGGRAMWRGIAAVPDIVVAPLARGLNALTEKGPTTASLITGEPERYLPKQKTITETADYLMDLMGAPRPGNAQERLSSDLTSALSGTGLTMGVGNLLGLGRGAVSSAAPKAGNITSNFLTAQPNVAPTVRNAAAQMLTSQPKTQIAATITGTGAAGVARESGATPGQQAAIGLVGGLAPGLTSALTAETTRRLARGGAGETMQGNISAFNAAGSMPTVGQAAGNRRMQATETFLASMPGGAGPIADKAIRQSQEFGSRIDELAAGLSPRGSEGATATSAGRAVAKGVDTFAKNIAARRKALYWQADQQIPPTTQLPLSNTSRTLTQLTALTPGAESTTASMINPRIAELANNVAEDLLAARAKGATGLPYSAVKDVRSRIGEELADFSLSADKPTAQYKRLYAALSEDMAEAARLQGPDAVRAMKRANEYYKLSGNRLEVLERIVDKNGGPEKVYQAALSGTGEGATTLRQVVRSIPSDSRKELTAAFIRRMGRANPSNQNDVGDVFSMATFLTNWNKVSPEAKRALFDTQGPAFSSSMNKIAKAADTIRDGSNVFRNPSGTGPRNALISGVTGTAASVFSLLAAGMPGAAAMAAGGAAGAGAALNGMGRAMANPRFVLWLSESTKMPVSSIPAQVAMLRRIAEQTDDDSVAEVADGLERMGSE